MRALACFGREAKRPNGCLETFTRGPASQRNLVGSTIVGQRNLALVAGLAVEQYSAHAVFQPLRILHGDVVRRGLIMVRDFNLVPAPWYAWVNTKRRAGPLKSEDRFEAHAIKPAGRSGVPRPTPAPA